MHSFIFSAKLGGKVIVASTVARAAYLKRLGMLATNPHYNSGLKIELKISEYSLSGLATTWSGSRTLLAPNAYDGSSDVMVSF
jgi:hypothetical protein